MMSEMSALGTAAISKAATLATCGVAMDVPSIHWL
jgi:hypothetical protein